MAVPMKNGGMKVSKVIFYVVLSGVTTGVGAFFGAFFGTISEEIIAICLSFAAGAMLKNNPFLLKFFVIFIRKML